MKQLPDIGARVRYFGYYGKMTGTVTAHYPSYGETCEDPDTGETCALTDSIGMRVDLTSDNWPYNDNIFAPGIEDVWLI